MTALSFEQLESFVGGHAGHVDVACPLCGPYCKSPSNRRRKVLRIWCDEPDFLTYSCARCGAQGYDHRYVHGGGGWSSRVDLRELARRRADADARAAQDVAHRQAGALRLWHEAGTIAGTLAEIYLASRGVLDAALPHDGDVLRFHPACPFDRASHPCMLALMRDIATDKPRGIQRTALTLQGRKLGRMTYGTQKGTAIKFGSPTEALVIGEGVETVLSVVALNVQPGSAVWSLICDKGVATFPIIDGVKHLIIVTDNDVAGHTAKTDCVNRWGKDWQVAGVDHSDTRASRLGLSDLSSELHCSRGIEGPPRGQYRVAVRHRACARDA